MRCFYCDTPLLVDVPPDHPQLATDDHVFPLAAVRRMRGMAFLSDAWRQLNKVQCCQRCNLAKGDKPPARWHATLPPDAARRLAERLVQLGADIGALV